MSMTQLEQKPTSPPDETKPAHAVLFDLAFAAISSRTLQVIAEHGVADALAPDESLDVGILAQRAGCDADALHRMLRLLSTFGIFVSIDGRWQHTECSLLLRTDNPSSMRAFARMLGQPQSWHCLTAMRHSLTTGRTTTELLDDGGLFGYLQHHPDEGAVFNDSMTAKAHGDTAAIIAANIFDDPGTV